MPERTAKRRVDAGVVFNTTRPLNGVCRILLVEDDPDDVLLFRHAVPEGCELQVAGSAPEGLKAVGNQLPDIIFLDLILPGMAGEDFCKQLRLSEDPRIARIPIVMVSGKSKEADAMVGRIIGADGYLTKPYAADMVQEEIHRHLPREKWPGRKTNKILVIEDDPDDRMLIETMLACDKRQSYSVVCMKRLHDGLDYLSQVKPELVITDLTLPDSEGIETFHQISRAAPRVPVIILSGRQDELLAEQAVHLGAQDFLLKTGLNAHSLSRSVRYGIERQSLIEANQQMALTDDLTGLHNRRGFMHLVDQELKAARRQGRPLVMVYLDMDNLKTINDTLGHEAGDRALQDLARLLQSTFRQSDILARLGGDEFAVVQVDFEGSNVEALRSRLTERIKKWNEIHQESAYRIEASFGIEMFDLQNHENNTALNDLIGRTDAAMYRNKELKKKS